MAMSDCTIPASAVRRQWLNDTVDSNDPAPSLRCQLPWCTRKNHHPASREESEYAPALWRPERQGSSRKGSSSGQSRRPPRFLRPGEGELTHATGAAKAGSRFPGLDVPETSSAVITSRDNPMSIWGELAARHEIMLEGPFLGPRSRVPKLGPVITSDGKKLFAVRREGDCEDAVLVTGAGHFH